MSAVLFSTNHSLSCSNDSHKFVSNQNSMLINVVLLNMYFRPSSIHDSLSIDPKWGFLAALGSDSYIALIISWCVISWLAAATQRLARHMRHMRHMRGAYKRVGIYIMPTAQSLEGLKGSANAAAYFPGR